MAIRARTPFQKGYKRVPNDRSWLVLLEYEVYHSFSRILIEENGQNSTQNEHPKHSTSTQAVMGAVVFRSFPSTEMVGNGPESVVYGVFGVSVDHFGAIGGQKDACMAQTQIVPDQSKS